MLKLKTYWILREKNFKNQNNPGKIKTITEHTYIQIGYRWFILIELNFMYIR